MSAPQCTCAVEPCIIACCTHTTGGQAGPTLQQHVCLPQPCDDLHRPDLSCPTCPYLHTTFQRLTYPASYFCRHSPHEGWASAYSPVAMSGIGLAQKWSIEGSTCSQKHIVTRTYCITKQNTMISRQKYSRLIFSDESTSKTISLQMWLRQPTQSSFILPYPHTYMYIYIIQYTHRLQEHFFIMYVSTYLKNFHII